MGRWTLTQAGLEFFSRSVLTSDTDGNQQQKATRTPYVAGDASVLATYSYSYDAAHRLRMITDSRGNKTLTGAYSAGGRLNQLADSEDRATNCSWWTTAVQDRLETSQNLR